MTQPLVEFDGVSKHFGASVAVHPMNLDINSGEFLAIMGSSGCGKTTTLRMLAGLDQPTAGEIRLDGVRMNEVRPENRETPMVWQSLALFPFLNVIKNVEFGLDMRGMDRQAARERALHWLERLEIAQFAERDISQLSGGQRQRVALARALATQPRILLLDEPLSALDANLVVRMQGVLSQLHADLGITFVYVTHSQSEAFAMADRVVIMSQGRIEQVGAPRTVYRSPATRFVAEFVGNNNLIEGRVSQSSKETTLIDAGDLLIEADLGANTQITQPLAPGDSATAVISADQIRVSSGHQAASEQRSINQLHCQLISEAFAGTGVTLLLETSQRELSVQLNQRDADALELRAGSPMTIQFDASSVYLLTSPQT